VREAVGEASCCAACRATCGAADNLRDGGDARRGVGLGVVNNLFGSNCHSSNRRATGRLGIAGRARVGLDLLAVGRCWRFFSL